MPEESKPAPTMTLRDIMLELESMYSLTIRQDGTDASETTMVVFPNQALALHKAAELIDKYILPRQAEFIRTFVQSKEGDRKK